MKPSRSFLLVVDVQEKLAPAVHGIDGVVDNIVRLIIAAEKLHIPIMFTEHCPDRIGHTVNALMDLVANGFVVEKSRFSAYSEEPIAQQFAKLNREQVIVAGTEAHVCVLQTAMELKQAGYQPYLVADGTSSRHLDNKKLAIERMRKSDIDIVSTEMVIFEWLERGDTDAFRELLLLIKN
ncbi:MAG: isochorismatase family protein [Gammaproteobacteria bacterium]|nr:isochorismatase family protein [Gammaproteobacteria bacterium]